MKKIQDLTRFPPSQDMINLYYSIFNLDEYLYRFSFPEASRSFLSKSLPGGASGPSEKGPYLVLQMSGFEFVGLFIARITVALDTLPS